MKFAIVIPAKNEEDYIGRTLKSVVSQTLKPVYCLVVDDSSKDKTAEIVKSYEKNYSIIHYFLNNDKQEYSLGSNIVRVFNKGKNIIEQRGIDFDYIIKMDADISFGTNFLDSIDRKITNGKWGIVSGTPYYMKGENRIYEYSPLWHSHGQFKIYNIECLNDIGGIDKGLGWDCADNIKAIDKEWRTAAFRNIYYEMHRKVGGKSNLIKGRINHGIGAYKLGYSLLYLILRSLHDLFKPPLILGSFSMLHGYFIGVFSLQIKRILSKRQIKLLRKLFWQSFFQRFKSKDFIILQQFRKKK